MKRIDLEKDIKASTIQKASKKFAEFLSKNGYDWAADEVVETVANGYFYCSNASLANLVKGGSPVHPQSNDWSYYWGIDHVDGNNWYAWFIDRDAE